METTGHSLQISLADGSLFSPQSIWICNHPWPYWGNIYGDGFASPLDSLGDHFYLWIHAVKADNREDSTHVLLAENFATGTPPYQPIEWKQTFLTDLFDGDNDSIQYLYFTMESTDSDPVYGPNTAVYFNADKLTVIKTGTAPAPTVKTVKTPAAARPPIEVTDLFPLTSYTGGEVIIYDCNRKEVWKTTVKAGEKPNLSELPKGEYILRHGHKHIPFKKVKQY
jgi:hypothetical protein